MRIVVDTNVLISATLWQGTPHRILELAEQKRVTLCATQPMLDELKEVLQRRKFERALKARNTSVEEIMSALLPLVELYPPTSVTESIPKDPDDEMFLACARSADAEYIVSGDEHLLKLERFGKMRIVSPADFLKEFEGVEEEA